MTGAPLSLADLATLLADPDADMTICDDALILDPAGSYPFRPSIGLNRARVAIHDAMASPCNGIASIVRRGRQQRYLRRIDGGWDGPRLIAEGDSWLQFPLARDLFSQLDRDHAIYCLAEPGDLLENLVRQNQVCDAIFEHSPHAVLVSAGGSDLLSGPQFRAFAKSFHRLKTPADFAACDFVQFIRCDLMSRFVSLVRKFRSVDASIPIIFHSYAYPMPRGAIWLGIPLQGQGIAEPAVQQVIVATIIDLFFDGFAEAMAAEALANVHIVDCRDAVGSDWFDEIHPNHRGFERISRRHRDVLGKML